MAEIVYGSEIAKKIIFSRKLVYMRQILTRERYYMLFVMQKIKTQI